MLVVNCNLGRVAKATVGKYYVTVNLFAHLSKQHVSQHFYGMEETDDYLQQAA